MLVMIWVFKQIDIDSWYLSGVQKGYNNDLRITSQGIDFNGFDHRGQVVFLQLFDKSPQYDCVHG